MDNNKKSSRKPNNIGKFARLSGIGFQMAITFYIAVYFGKKIDAHYQHEKNIITLIFVVLAMIISIYNILQQLKRIQK